MRSAELARLAGVTVRTLRHYHQAGVLDEPPRTENGYREYDVRDLVRLLRIRRLADLGVALDRIPSLLDDDTTAGDVLLQLDSALADRIAQLERTRATVALLREHRAAPDLPPALAPFVGAFATAGLSAASARVEREQTVLLAHLAGADGERVLGRFYARLSEPRTAAVAVALADRFATLAVDDPPAAVDDLVDGYVALLGPVLENLGAEAVDMDGAEHLVDEYLDRLVTAPQREVLDRIRARLQPE